MTKIIKLTSSEMMQAALTGIMRRISSIYKGRDDKSNGNIGRDHNWSTDIDGASGEMAFAKYLQAYFSSSINTFKAPDVGNWQVRSTPCSSGRLIVRKDDSDEDRFVLVICSPPEFRIVGYLQGGDAKRDHFFHSDDKGPDCWMVPQDRLISV